MIERILSPITSFEGVREVRIFDSKGKEIYKNTQKEDTDYIEPINLFFQFLENSEISISSLKLVYKEGILIIHKLNEKKLFILTEPFCNTELMYLTLERILEKIKRYFYLTEILNCKIIPVILSSRVSKGSVRIDKEFLKKWEEELSLSNPKYIEIETLEGKREKFRIQTKTKGENKGELNPEDAIKLRLADNDLVMARLIKGVSEAEEFFK